MCTFNWGQINSIILKGYLTSSVNILKARLYPKCKLRPHDCIVFGCLKYKTIAAVHLHIKETLT